MKILGAVLAAVVTGFILIFGIEFLSQVMYPPPPGLDYEDPAVMAQHMQNAPTGALLLVALAHLAAGLFGNIVGLLVGQRKRLAGFIFSGLLIAGTVANLVAIPHPVWFMIVDVLGVLLGIFLAFKLIKSPSKR